MRRWPYDWEERKGGKDCAMCAPGRPEETGYLAGRHSDAYLQRQGVVRGDTIVIEVARALEGEYHPVKVDIEMLGDRGLPEDQLRAGASAVRKRLST